MRKQGTLEGSANERVCYFTIRGEGEEGRRVRFGFVRRVSAQIEVDWAHWQRIAERLCKQGCKLIEQVGKASGVRSKRAL
jgi:hypothetical protein